MAAAKRRTTTETELLARIAALEERVARLETGRAPPGDGRAAAVKREKTVKRCPGCGLPLRRRAGRCAACGRPLASL
jgi:ribosomal protein L34E